MCRKAGSEEQAGLSRAMNEPLLPDTTFRTVRSSVILSGFGSVFQNQFSLANKGGTQGFGHKLTDRPLGDQPGLAAESPERHPTSNAFTSCTLLRMQALAGYGEGRKSQSPRFFLCTLRFELQEAE